MSMLVIVSVCYKLEELCKLLPDVLQASRDSVTLFGEEPAYASELVLWAHSITEHYFALLKRHVLSSAAVAGGLRSAAECVKVSLAHCLLLEEQGLTLCPTLSKLMRPSVEQALQANLRKIEGSVAVLAAADDWVLGHPAILQHGNRTHSRPGISVVTSNLKLSSSAHHLNILVQVCDCSSASAADALELTSTFIPVAFCTYLHHIHVSFYMCHRISWRMWNPLSACI